MQRTGELSGVMRARGAEARADAAEARAKAQADELDVLRPRAEAGAAAERRLRDAREQLRRRAGRRGWRPSRFW